MAGGFNLRPSSSVTENSASLSRVFHCHENSAMEIADSQNRARAMPRHRPIVNSQDDCKVPSPLAGEG